MSPRRRLLYLVSLGLVPLTMALWFPAFNAIGIFVNLAIGVLALGERIDRASFRHLLAWLLEQKG